MFATTDLNRRNRRTEKLFRLLFLLMTVLLVRVSGVRLLEAGLLDSRPEYAEYVERTSPFLPLPPRRWEGRQR